MRDGQGAFFADQNQSRAETLLLDFDARIPEELVGLSRHEFLEQPRFCQIALEVDERGGFRQLTMLLPWTGSRRPPVRISVQLVPARTTPLEISVNVPAVLIDWVFVVSNVPGVQIENFGDAGFLKFEEIDVAEGGWGVSAFGDVPALRSE